VAELEAPGVPPEYGKRVLAAYTGGKLSAARTIELLWGTVPLADTPAPVDNSDTSKLQVVDTTTVAGGRIDGLAALSSRDAWAAGTEFGSTGLPRPLILRWDGHRWAHVAAAPVPELLEDPGQSRAPVDIWVVTPAAYHQAPDPVRAAGRVCLEVRACAVCRAARDGEHTGQAA